MEKKFNDVENIIWTKTQMEIKMNEQINELINKWTNNQMNELVKEEMNKVRNEYTKKNKWIKE